MSLFSKLFRNRPCWRLVREREGSEVTAEAAQLSLPRIAPLPIGLLRPSTRSSPHDYYHQRTRQELLVFSLAFVTFMVFLTFPLCPLAFLLTLTLMALAFLLALTLLALSSFSISLHAQLQ